MIFLNGRMVARTEARIDPADRGLLLGDGLFETLRAYRGRPARLEAHMARLEAGAAVLGIPLPLGGDQIRAGFAETLAANRLTRGDAALRLTLTRGPGPRGLPAPDDPAPTLMITAGPLAPAADTAAGAIVATMRRNEHSPLANLKSLGYLDNVLARRQAAEQGADEALLLNTAGRLASASAANLFLVRGRSLFTPPLSEGVLPGVTRAAILELAAGLNLEAHETPLAPDDLRRCEEAFLTNSLIELRPLVALDGRDLGDGHARPVTGRLHQAFRDSGY
jgi:branched-chain amino acid aminotransferase